MAAFPGHILFVQQESEANNLLGGVGTAVSWREPGCVAALRDVELQLAGSVASDQELSRFTVWAIRHTQDGQGSPGKPSSCTFGPLATFLMRECSQEGGQRRIHRPRELGEISNRRT